MIWIDPLNIAHNPRIPTVLIHAATADGQSYAPDQPLRLPPRTQRLDLQFTALSLGIPQRVQFRYRRVGFDDDWQSAQPRRNATYTGLGPGHYRFEVMGTNDDGLWNPRPATLDITLPPAWWQTGWFRSSLVGLCLLVLGTLYRWRVRQIDQQAQLRLQGQLGERQRIARELHDTLIQGIQGLLLQLDALAACRTMEFVARLWLREAKKRCDGGKYRVIFDDSAAIFGPRSRSRSRICIVRQAASPPARRRKHPAGTEPGARPCRPVAGRRA